MPKLSQKQLITLVLLTLTWGVNWPVMKLGVQDFPPLTFRAICMVLSLPVMAAALAAMKVPFRVPREHWGRVLLLGLVNMVLWHSLIIVAVPMLSSGRAAILGYTMPIFSAMLGAWIWGDRLAPRAWLGVGAAACGVMLLLWNEFDKLGGRPTGVALMLIGASTWALGTQLLRRATLPVPTLTLAFWMTVETTIALGLLSVVFEHGRWQAPPAFTVGAIAFNALLVIGFAQVAWFYLARSLPPLASTLSVMMIPVLGVFSGAIWLNEQLHWQDWASVALMMVAIASVLWPTQADAADKKAAP
ncbi:MAG: DMT family transporter [Comamonas sp.]